MLAALIALAVLQIVTLVALFVLARRNQAVDLHPVVLRLEAAERMSERLERGLRDDLARQRLEMRQQVDTIRTTVDEHLRGTLERRLDESFSLVSDRLELVHQGLGEMRTLAAGVGDLKKVLTNVKVRGTWGEVQLGNLLEQILTPAQYAQNVCTKGEGAERVEYAIRLPGKDASPSGASQVWLPIDAKFPNEDFLRLVDAVEAGDVAAADAASRALDVRVKQCARDISEKYIAPPATTDFAIMFLPTEGLFAEVIRRPGLADLVQREFRVAIAGPTTLAALLNSLQMGFRTFAIEKRSSEVWTVLGEAKTEFRRYADVLDRIRNKLLEATTAVDKASVRTRAIERKLQGVEETVVDSPVAVPPPD
ncbi:MAG TPA: DNA recombination protein RmuC [Gemmatimonadaceae bacterium]|jgi:DNA recombination protein RmuC